MKIEKTVEVKLTLNTHEIGLLQKYLEWARLYARIKKDSNELHLISHETWQDFMVEAEVVMNKISAI